MLVSRLYTLIGLAVVAVGVSAQSIDACIVTCLTLAEGSNTCNSYTNVSCVCASKAYQNLSSACLKANCTTADQEAALQLQESNCGSTSTNGIYPSRPFFAHVVRW
ncbi:hypothetical protein BGW80DRAFT_1185570 [Lactifluus volemus]|nr:hypothetical protein BGW80DRAFT_1185570 [Lactifluus volemus]